MRKTVFIPIVLFISATLLISIGCKKENNGDTDKNPTKNQYLNPNLKYDLVMDIDGNKYATIQIGTQTWMAENLRTTKYNDGTPILNVTDNDEWGDLHNGRYCIYGNLFENKQTYGLLYNWYAVNTGKLCPDGWHIPSDTEWSQLTIYLGNIGGKLKAVGNISNGTGLWQFPNTDATNESGFSGLPGGYRHSSGEYQYIGSHGLWWSSKSWTTDGSWMRYLSYDNSGVGKEIHQMLSGFSCRCIKD